MIKVILLDIDGTLTNSKKEITPKTRDALLSAEGKGCILVLASGRPTQGLERYVRELKMNVHNGILISYNGAMVSGAENGKVYFKNLIPQNKALDLLKHLRSFNGLGIVLEEDGYVITENCFKNTIDYKGERFGVLEYETRMNGCLIKEVSSFEEYLDHDTPKVLTYACPEYLKDNSEKMASGFDDLSHMYTADFYYEFTNKGIDKTKAIKESLVNVLGFKKEEMIAFGDAANDRSMLEFAGIGVAMGNASEDLKKIADYVTDDNNSDGIATALEKYL